MSSLLEVWQLSVGERQRIEQEMIMAREIDAKPRVLRVAQPTRGVDIGAAEYIHRRMIEQGDQGAAVVTISEDLDEILAVADRVVVMFEGRVMGVVDAATADRSQIGLMMAGSEMVTP